MITIGELYTQLGALMSGPDALPESANVSIAILIEVGNERIALADCEHLEVMSCAGVDSLEISGVSYSN